MSCYLVQEIDGVGRFTLEDGSGFLVLEDCIPEPPFGGGLIGVGDRRVHHERIRRRDIDEDDVEAFISVILGGD